MATENVNPSPEQANDASHKVTTPAPTSALDEVTKLRDELTFQTYQIQMLADIAIDQACNAESKDLPDRVMALAGSMSTLAKSVYAELEAAVSRLTKQQSEASHV
jgi:hypothetical protein